jgi:hypothetical protein
LHCICGILLYRRLNWVDRRDVVVVIVVVVFDASVVDWASDGMLRQPGG